MNEAIQGARASASAETRKRIEEIETQLKNTQETQRIYQNINELISQSTFKGNVAPIVSESINHVNHMIAQLGSEVVRLKISLEALSAVQDAPLASYGAGVVYQELVHALDDASAALAKTKTN